MQGAHPNPDQPLRRPTIAELLPWHDWWADFQAAPSALEALDIFVGHGVRTLERVVAMHGAVGDAEAASVVRTAEERRAAAYGQVARVVARTPGGLRPGLTPAAATDLLLVLFSAELYQALSAGRGWSRPRCTTFFRNSSPISSWTTAPSPVVVITRGVPTTGGRDRRRPDDAGQWRG